MTWFSHPLLALVNVQCIINLAVLGFGWLATARSREKFVERLTHRERKDPTAFLHPDVDGYHVPCEGHHPPIAIVMPCKGLRARSLDNWRSVLASCYPGRTEFIFVVESDKDRAVEGIQQLKREQPDKTIKLVVAGLTWHCTQKIANLLEGLDSCSSDIQYVLFLDDDILLHPGTALTLVDVLEKDAKVFVSSGYSFDVPVKGSRFFAYLVMAYRLINFAGFSTDRPSFVWGGCMMFRRAELESSTLLDALRDGGYSDDLILSVLCKEDNRTTACPMGAIFPNLLERDDFAGYWNYLARQLYVCDTYVSIFSKWYNRSMLYMQVASSAVFTVPLAISLCLLVRFFLGVAFPSYVDSLPMTPSCHWNLVSAICVLTAHALLSVGLLRLTRAMTTLCNRLSPDMEALDPGSTWFKLLFALPIHLIMAFIITFVVLVRSEIVWSGIKYVKKDGRVARVSRRDSKGMWYSIPPETSLEESVRRHAERKNKIKVKTT